MVKFSMYLNRRVFVMYFKIFRSSVANWTCSNYTESVVYVVKELKA